MARKFLYVIAVLVVLFIVGRIALTFYADDLTEMAFVPDDDFAPQAAGSQGDWEKTGMWISRPGLKNDPTAWLPQGAKPLPAVPRPAAVFFVHPTSYMEKARWNASLSDDAANARARLFTQFIGSPFAAAGPVWTPRYRQATVGAFFTDRPDAGKALDLAYGDVLAAFDVFVKANPDGPIVLAGHSQGAFLLRRLMQDRVAGTPLAGRIAAAYLPGWPVSTAQDLPLMGLPACTAPDQAGCVSSWLTVADPADTAMLVKGQERRGALDGKPIGKGAFLCTNPLTGTEGGESDAAANQGTLVPDFAKGKAVLEPEVVPAACGADHFLHIGPAPKLEMGEYVMPGNNYHVYDVPLFWANLRADVRRRLGAWNARHPAEGADAP